MVVRQREGESLKDYVVQFNQARLMMDNMIEEMVYAALYQGLRVEWPLMVEVTFNMPENLTDLTDMIEKYVNQEETLVAQNESRKSEVLELGSSGKNKKVRQEEKQTETKATVGPKKYHQIRKEQWNPLNSPINEVLMEIKKDPQYEHPCPLYSTRVRDKNLHKFCAFHNSRGHSTEECINLQILIEKFIKNEKLLHFIVDNQGTPGKIKDLDNTKARDLDNIKPRSLGIGTILLRGAKKIGEREEEKNLDERRFREVEAKGPSTATLKMSGHCRHPNHIRRFRRRRNERR